ncbi:hypothetical protein AGMMS49944_23230 [Spirochaetia bacterium]|nr:hypothetical protein AGMMS49944_23230 [Spirochaetia bacterium]
MMEEAKIARLWSNFHRLSDEHKRLILKVTELIIHLPPPVLDTGSGKGSRVPKTSNHKKRI